MTSAYAAAGVDIEAGDRAVELMKAHVAATRRPEVLGGLGGFAGYTRTVGRVFSPPVTLIFCAKVFLLGSAVAWIPLVTVLQNPAGRRSRASAELQGLVRLFLVVLAIEAAALIGNYH